MRTQSWINKVNKVKGLQQKLVTYNRALALLDYHNHQPLVPKTCDSIVLTVFPVAVQMFCRGRMGKLNNYLLVLPI